MAVRKRYVAVDSFTDTAGIETPRVIHWTGGEQYRVADVLRVVNRQHAKVGGTGTCYTCQFENGGIARVYHEALEDDASSILGAKWFVEEKVPSGGAEREG